MNKFKSIINVIKKFINNIVHIIKSSKFKFPEKDGKKFIYSVITIKNRDELVKYLKTYNNTINTFLTLSQNLMDADNFEMFYKFFIINLPMYHEKLSSSNLTNLYPNGSIGKSSNDIKSKQDEFMYLIEHNINVEDYDDEEKGGAIDELFKMKNEKVLFIQCPECGTVTYYDNYSDIEDEDIYCEDCDNILIHYTHKNEDEIIPFDEKDSKYIKSILKENSDIEKRFDNFLDSKI